MPESTSSTGQRPSRAFVFGFFRTGAVATSWIVLPIAILAIWQSGRGDLVTYTVMIVFVLLIWAAGIWVNLGRYRAKVRRAEIPPAEGDSEFRRGMTAAKGMF